MASVLLEKRRSAANHHHLCPLPEQVWCSCWSASFAGRRCMMFMVSSSLLWEPSLGAAFQDWSCDLQPHCLATPFYIQIYCIWWALFFQPFWLVQLSNCTSLPITGDLFTVLEMPVGGQPKHSLFTLCSLIWHPVLPFATSLLSHCDNAPLHCTIPWGSQIHHYTHNNFLLPLSVEKF